MPYATPLSSPTVTVPFSSSSHALAASGPRPSPPPAYPNGASSSSSSSSFPDRALIGNPSTSSTSSPSSSSPGSSSSSLSSHTTAASPAMVTPMIEQASPAFESNLVEPEEERSLAGNIFAQGRKGLEHDLHGNGNDGLPSTGLNQLKDINQGRTTHRENGLQRLSIADMREAYYGDGGGRGGGVGAGAKAQMRSDGLPPASPMHRYLDSLIVVQPPTPDRGPDEGTPTPFSHANGDTTPTTSQIPHTSEYTSSSLSKPSTLSSSSTASNSTITGSSTNARTNGHVRTGSGSLHNLAVNQQVLPPVRSPPRSTSVLGLGIGQQAEEEERRLERSSFSSSLLSDASSVPADGFDHVDSLHLTQKRGRRKLFGFTEMANDSGSSSASTSRDGSRDSSPARAIKGGLEITSMRYPKKEQAGRGTNTPPEGSLSPPVPEARLPQMNGSSHPDSYSFSAPSTPAFAPQQTLTRRHPASRNGSSTFLASQVRQTPVSPRLPVRPAGLSTRTSAQRNEGALKLDLQSIRPQATVSGPVSPAMTPGSLIRKKSGELVKPSLKSSSSYSDVTELGPPSTRSLPSTPGFGKNVHFDTQLERVKLFLHDQKPQIVSRDGSPNEYYTTSEGEGEYPFPTQDDESSPGKRTQLEIELPNFPSSHSEHADVYMESITLDEDRKSLRGAVCVRNLSFQKWVAVRFTFDWWQTTSEVTALHKESLPGGQFDRFTFTVKLHDILAKIEEKTLFIALRYSIEGREIWDSNNGNNYQVTFTKVPVATRRLAGARSSVSAASGRLGSKDPQWNGNSAKQDRMADLRARLNKLSDDERGSLPVEVAKRAGSPKKFGSFGARKLGDLNGSGMELDIAKARDSPGAGITSPLAARYDFGVSLQSSRGGKGSSPGGRRRELSTENLGGLQLGSEVTTGPSMEFYSPQPSKIELPSGLAPRQTPQESAKAGTDKAYQLQMPPPDLRVQRPSPPSVDYFTPAARSATIAPISSSARTSTTTSLPSMYTAPPFQMSEFSHGQDARQDTRQTQAMDNASPPSISSSCDSNSDTESPISPPPDRALPEWSPHKTLSLDDFGKLSYSSILEQFCWAGSNGGTPQQHPAVGDRRSASTSSVDQFYADAFSSGSGRRSNAGSGFTTPVASDMTPTSSGYGFSSAQRFPSKGQVASSPVLIQKRPSGSCSPSPVQTPISSPTRTLRSCVA